ncbi:hypothetical protein ABW19_dt0203177 [Dactylella cylindrospora]|nr:hypothetical protein ABW19_dt0203177 [Dactylella cylindrospora]
MGLTELVAVASNPTPSAGGSSSPEAYISLHDVHAFSQTSIFKKSSTPQNCLAVSPTHIFAAQSDKTVLNVYNRAKGNLETTIPLPEQLSAIACSRNGGVVAMGTTSGRVNIWETSSGRYTSTPLSHLQKVTAITFDATSTLLLTGSEDTNILVWSIPHLTAPNSKKQPIRTLEYHQQPIVSLVCGKGSGPSAIAVSASKDSSCIVWNYHEGTLLRTFTLGAIPTSLALDPADRAFYVGLGDGGIQQIEFAKVGNRTVDVGLNGASDQNNGDADRSYDSPLYRSDEKHIPISASSSGSRWTAEGQDSPVTAMDVLFEGNYLIAGTETGSVNVWDVATGHLFRTLATYKAPISCVTLLPPTGFAEPSILTTQQTVIPPRYHEAVKASSQNTVDVDTTLPPLSLQFNGVVPIPGHSSTDPFSAAADMDAIDRGIAYFNSPAFTSDAATGNAALVATSVRSAEDVEKIDELQKELAAMKERYTRLSEVHKQTWEEHTKWVMEVDKDKAEKMLKAGEAGGEGDGKSDEGEGDKMQTE